MLVVTVVINGKWLGLLVNVLYPPTFQIPALCAFGVGLFW
jgi:hypothetical protein